MAYRALVTLLVSFMMLCNLPPVASGDDVPAVSVRSGNTIIVDINGSGDYTSIQAAVENASDGDTIRVWAGLYRDNIEIHGKSLSILGNGTKDTVIEGYELNEDVFHIFGDDVKMENISIQEPNWAIRKFPYFPYPECIDTYDSRNMSIRNCVVENRFDAIAFDRCEAVEIIDCFISSNESCIDVQDTYELTLSGNEFHNGRLDLNGNDIEQLSSFNITRDNLLDTHPIYFLKDIEDGEVPAGGSQYILVNCSDTHIDSLYDGQDQYSMELYYCEFNGIFDQTFNKIDGPALYLYQSNYNVISSNEFRDCGTGIYIAESIDNMICDNGFNNNDEKDIHISRSNRHSIYLNEIDDSAHYGIYLDDVSTTDLDSNNIFGAGRSAILIDGICDRLRLYDNIGSDGEFGLQAMKLQNSLISGNYFNHNRADGISMSGSFRVDINHNSCENNNGSGIVIGMPDTTTNWYVNLSKNHCTFNNGDGIRLFNASSCLVNDSHLTNNSGTGLNVINGTQNVYTRNVFQHNGIQASDDGNNEWARDGYGNYWSDYNGSDDGSNNRTAGDGIGDTNLPHLGYDMNPMMEPLTWLYPTTPALNTTSIDGDGNYVLSWNAIRAWGYVLEESLYESFNETTVIYEGPESYHNVTEQPEGLYYYRVMSTNNALESDWSPISNVTVDYDHDDSQVPPEGDDDDDNAEGATRVAWTVLGAAIIFVILVQYWALVVIRRKKEEARKKNEGKEEEPDYSKSRWKDDDI